jgi:hypothetical protein
MVGPIIPPPTPQAPPAGSISIDYDFVIPAVNLALLSDSASSSLLSASNIGKTVKTTINSTLDLIRTYEDYNAYLLDGTLLDGLANTSTVSYSADAGSSNYCRVVIILGEITPLAGGKVVISDGVTAYELSVSTTTDNKRLEFNNIPADFVNSFTVENLTGTSFASGNNSILVVNL